MSDELVMQHYSLRSPGVVPAVLGRPPAVSTTLENNHMISICRVKRLSSVRRDKYDGAHIPIGASRQHNVLRLPESRRLQ
eukprot:scaffold357524_cov15-Prasinocladus_malaysianus.AAC.1